MMNESLLYATRVESNRLHTEEESSKITTYHRSSHQISSTSNEIIFLEKKTLEERVCKLSNIQREGTSV